MSLTKDEDARKEIISLGGVRMMVGLLESKNPQVLKYACGALINLTNEQESWEEIQENNGVKLLLDIIENEKDPIMIIKLKEVYSAMEIATDKCEDAANVIKTILIKYS